MSEIIEDKVSQSAKISLLAIVTLIAGILTTPFLFLSTYMVGVQPLGLSGRTYEKIDQLSNILPIIPVLLGGVALIHIGLSHKKRKGVKLVIWGIGIAIVSAAIFWLCLVSWSLRSLQ